VLNLKCGVLSELEVLSLECGVPSGNAEFEVPSAEAVKRAE
jgi:hypothetical protein